MKNIIAPDPEQLAAELGISLYAAKKRIASQADGLLDMALRADAAKNGKFDGYTAADLRTHAEAYRQASL